MKVSVVIPLYNKVRHIRRAIDSVLAQTLQDFELIVVDDGSTDGSGEIVREFTDPRIRLIVQENAGVSAARNRGIREAFCDLVAFLDADDEWLPSFLETVMGLRARHPEAGMYATAYRCSQHDATWRPAFTECGVSPQGGLLEDYFRAALGPAPVWSSAVMIPKRMLAEVGCFPVGVRRGEDLRTWAVIALRYRVAWSPVDGAVYHLSADNRACGVRTRPDTLMELEIEDFLRSGPEPVSSRSMIEAYVDFQRLSVVMECHLEGKKAWALSMLDQTRGTAMFKRRRLLLQCAVWIAPSVLRGALGLKAVLRHRLRRKPS